MQCRFHLLKLGKEFPQLARLVTLLMPSREVNCERPVMCVALWTRDLVSLNLLLMHRGRLALEPEAEVFRDRKDVE